MNKQPQIMEEEVSDKLLTAPNVITLIRFLLIPIYLWLLFVLHQEIAALIVFALAASTDWIDGQVARRTGQVSKVGKIFDPLVDRFLIASGVVSICLLGRLPIWVPIFLIARDLILLIEGKILLKISNKVPSVIYSGKFATAFLLFGFCFLMLNAPYVPSLHIFSVTWLPGFGFDTVALGMYFVYIGVILSFITFVIYQVRGIEIFVSESKH